ncbi:MAG: prolipoprotein diacylglyceryl transferase [Spirochaetota bacterium]
MYLEFPSWLRAELIPGLPFRWYGLMYLIAFAITYLLFMVQMRQRKLDVDQDTVVNFFFWGIIGLLIGARLFATLFFDPTGIYLQRPWLIFWPFRDGRFVGLQGMNYYGGLVGAALGFVIYARVKKIPILDWGDMLLCGVPLGYMFGRLGNFINGELYGRVTRAAWGVVFPEAARFPASEEWVQEFAADVGIEVAGPNAFVNLPRHPTQLYEGLTEGLILWLVVWFLLRKRKPFDGFIIGFYVIAYGVIRFVIDYFRMPISAQDFAVRPADTGLPVHFVQSPLNLIPSQFYSLVMVLGGAVFLYVAARLAKRRAGENAGDEETQREDRSRSMRKLRKKVK